MGTSRAQMKNAGHGGKEEQCGKGPEAAQTGPRRMAGDAVEGPQDGRGIAQPTGRIGVEKGA